MNITHYMFAFFVFVLICVCIWLFGKVMRGGSKDDKNNYEKEQRLFKLYQNVEDMMSSFEEYVEEAQSKIDESLKRVDALLEKGTYQQPEALQPSKVQSAAKKKPDVPKIQPGTAPEEAIPYLIEHGMGRDEIAKQLGISSREVTLIMGIKKMKKPDNNI